MFFWLKCVKLTTFCILHNFTASDAVALRLHICYLTIHRLHIILSIQTRMEWVFVILSCKIAIGGCLHPNASAQNFHFLIGLLLISGLVFHYESIAGHD